MEGSASGMGRLDCYEDMFKEITRKLYGDDPDHRTSSVQNEFETSVSYKNEDDTDHGTDGSDDGNWTCEDEPFKSNDGSRIAAYHAGKTTWRCYECGDCMGGGPRDVAEHFMELHSSRIIGDDLRNKHNSPRKDYLQNDFKIEEVVSYLERVRDRAERAAPPSRRTQETQTVPAALLPTTTSTFLLQELPSASSATQHHLHQSSASMTASGSTSGSGKRYTCSHCPYGTDRRDLYTRHENIHREEKPFHCYVCYKPFNRADHVKKHFLRMHREHGYELSRIRRSAGSSRTNTGAGSGIAVVKTLQPGTNNSSITANGTGIQHANYGLGYNSSKNYQLQTGPASNGTGNTGLYHTSSISVSETDHMDANCGSGNKKIQNGGCNSKSHLKGGTKGTQERRYTCCYCSWSGVDNWCLKRHLNTHLKPFACALCEYKAARAERLATHVLKVHNKRQCSRCSFVGEDATQLQVHQMHVHRVNSASMPTSTASTPPPPNNRHQQSVPPSGGGRPPPGPPVFPASSPGISLAPSVIPSTAILGKGGLAEIVGTPCYVRWNNDESRQACDHRLSGEGGKRSRKQRTPRRAMIEHFEEIDDVPNGNENNRLASKTVGPKHQRNDTLHYFPGSKIDFRMKNRMSDQLLRCHRCPSNAPARGLSWRPYHTKASLTLHTLWRHRHIRTSLRNLSEALRPYRSAERHEPAITLTATVLTTRSSSYSYHR